ncbi:DMT family transporter [Roseococcus sp. YIM B11640]|uniref:DMT family transporter n=1 Tax=Roseococcus sp. YIM B11640 TaxID=3133973 RepID=UPI003C7A748C
MSQARALQTLLLAVLLFGGVWPLTKHAFQDATPLWFGFSRAALASVSAGAMLALMGRLRLPSRRDRVLVLIVGGLQIGGFFALAHLALVLVPAGRTAILGNVTLFWLVPLSVWLLGEQVSRRRWLAAGLGLLGVGVMMGPWAIDWTRPGIVIGHFMLLGASLLWSIAIVAMRKRPPQAPVMELLPWIFMVGALVILPIALWREPLSAGGGIGPHAIWTALFIGMVAAPIGTWAVVESGRHLNAVLASVGFLMVPLLGLVLATTWLGEPLGWDLILGGALVVLSVIVAAKA